VNRRVLLLGILVYVTLDLSLAEMPGAFVFRPADSVETTQGARFRDTASVSEPPTFAADPLISLRACPPAVTLPAVRADRDGCFPRVVSLLPRAALLPARSEDPH